MNVSILIPTYRRPALLVEAINSCLAQTYPPFEIIIGDDSPDDLTQTVVNDINASTPITIRYVHNRPQLRQTQNVNNLFSLVRGDTAMLLHDDDLLMPDSLAVLAGIFESDPTIDIAFGKQYIINDEGIIDYRSSEGFNRDFYRISEYEGTVLSSFESGLSQQFPNNGYLIKSSILKTMTYTSVAGDACDYEFGYRLGLAGYKMYFVDQYLGKYRLSNMAISLSKSNDSAYQAFNIIRKSVPTSQLAREVRAKRLFEKAPIAITGAVNTGKRRTAISILFSKWYRHRLFSPRGIKRFLHVFFYVDTDNIVRAVSRVKNNWFRRPAKVQH